MDVQFRELGSSGIKVSTVAMGCWPIAGMTSLNVNTEDSLKTLYAAFDSGINFFDTAHCYGLDGGSEKLVGKLMEGRQDQVVVATKCGVHWDGQGEKVVDGSASRIRWECEESLRRLKIESIDLMYLHRPDPSTPINESAAALRELQVAGKVKAVGLSNASLHEIQKFHSVCPLVAIQPPFNFLQPQTIEPIRPWCMQNDVSVVNYWPLMKGLLAGKIRRNYQFDPADKRLTYPIFQGDCFESAQVVLDRLEPIAESLSISISQLVIAWTIGQACITSTLCGAKRDWQIQETARAMSVQLDDDVIQVMDRIAAEYSLSISK
ncbi:MAG: aldo/keto reductase [Planctomycetota bacterium]